MSEYNKVKKEQKQNEDANKIDPDNHIRYLIEDTITRVPLLDNKMSIVDKFNDLDIEMSNVFNSCVTEMKKLSERLKKIEKENSEMEEEILTLKIQAKNTQKHIKNILAEKF
jgi:predicted transcriptional regulator